MEVNKTMYGNNEDVPEILLDTVYTDLHVQDVAFAVESHLCDVTFAVVWNVLAAHEKKVSINHQ